MAYSEPTKNLRYIETFLSHYVQSMIYGAEWPTEKNSRNRKTQVENIQLEHPTPLHSIWRYAEKNNRKKGIIYKISVNDESKIRKHGL